MLCVVALLSVFLCSSLAQDTALQARFDNFTELNANPLYELYWSVDGNVTSFAVRVQTTGWVGFGISENGLMLNSDVIMGLVDEDGAANLTDRRADATTRIEPAIDDDQDWDLLNGTEDGGFTTLEFSRLLNTEDLTGDIAIGESVNLIWSLGATDDTSVQHTNQGAQLNVRLIPQGTTGPGGGTLTPAPGGPGTRCPCTNVQACSAGYVFDERSCRCVCAARTSEDIWYQRFEECRRSHHSKIYSIFSCGCECSKRIKCDGKRVVDPKDCRCVCPTKSCTRPKYLNHHTCDCECPYHQCYGGQTLDRDTCQCKCTRTCQDYEELDSRSCYCRRKAPTRPLTRPPLRITHPPPRFTRPPLRITHPPPRFTRPPPRITRPPITLTPPPRGSRCTHQSYHSCDRLHPYDGGPCQWVNGKCQPRCCGPKEFEGVRFRHHYREDCSSHYSAADCSRRSSCSWHC